MASALTRIPFFFVSKALLPRPTVLSNRTRLVLQRNALQFISIRSFSTEKKNPENKQESLESKPEAESKTQADNKSEQKQEKQEKTTTTDNNNTQNDKENTSKEETKKEGEETKEGGEETKKGGEKKRGIILPSLAFFGTIGLALFGMYYTGQPAPLVAILRKHIFDPLEAYCKNIVDNFEYYYNISQEEVPFLPAPLPNQYNARKYTLVVDLDALADCTQKNGAWRVHKRAGLDYFFGQRFNKIRTGALQQRIRPVQYERGLEA